MIEENADRFVVECEFVQCLSNPKYLHFLAQEGYLVNEAFIGYVKYLNDYWRRPEYMKFITYPQSLLFLDMLQSEKFRLECTKADFVEYLHQQQFHHWLRHKFVDPPETAEPDVDATTATT